MTNSNGVGLLRLRQLRAMAENLYMLANLHRENHNYVVASALYDRALFLAQEIQNPEDDGSVLVARIRTDQQAVFEMLSAGESAKAHGVREDTKAEMKAHGMHKNATEHGHMTVTGLTMVSESCQK